MTGAGAAAASAAAPVFISAFAVVAAMAAAKQQQLQQQLQHQSCFFKELIFLRLSNQAKTKRLVDGRAGAHRPNALDRSIVRWSSRWNLA